MIMLALSLELFLLFQNILLMEILLMDLHYLGIPNNDVSWENQIQTNVGVDLKNV